MWTATQFVRVHQLTCISQDFLFPPQMSFDGHSVRRPVATNLPAFHKILLFALQTSMGSRALSSMVSTDSPALHKILLFDLQMCGASHALSWMVSTNSPAHHKIRLFTLKMCVDGHLKGSRPQLDLAGWPVHSQCWKESQTAGLQEIKCHGPFFIAAYH